MTSSTSKPLLTALSAEERDAWAAQNALEERMRESRFGRMSFHEKLSALESRGRELTALRQRASERRTQIARVSAPAAAST